MGRIEDFENFKIIILDEIKTRRRDLRMGVKVEKSLQIRKGMGGRFWDFKSISQYKMDVNTEKKNRILVWYGDVGGFGIKINI